MPPSRTLPIALASVFVLGSLAPATSDTLPEWNEVRDYDQPPRPIKITKPKYPKDACAKRVAGIVEVAILIDARGKVTRARVLKSIPSLDQAALDTVEQWRFFPAMKNGRSVATIARAPIIFETDPDRTTAPRR